jgi:hypothetical protein
VLLGNAQLEQVYSEVFDRYSTPSQGVLLWHGRVACRVVDRAISSVLAGPQDTSHQTMIWLPAGLVADDGTMLYLQIDYQLHVRQDSVVTLYRVADWSDFGQRILGSPSDVRVIVERRPA